MNAISLVGKLTFASHYLKLINDPTNLEHVISLNKSMVKFVSPEHKAEVIKEFKANDLSRQALVMRPRVGKVNFSELAALPENTFGRAYYNFLTERNLNPNDLPCFDPENTGDEFTYARAHLFETHDIWHVVTGFNTDIPGELGLQAFYMTQFPAQLSLILFSSSFLNQAQMPFQKSRELMEAMITGYSMGKNAHLLLGRDWKQEWNRDLGELREELGLSSAFSTAG